jgi:hypothetical protein
MASETSISVALKEEESIKEGIYVPDGIVPVCQCGCLIQEGADNIDINTEIIDDKDTFQEFQKRFPFVRHNLKLFQKLWENVLEFLVPLALRTVGMTFVSLKEEESIKEGVLCPRWHCSRLSRGMSHTRGC